jgi:lipoprotein-releasing system permease protein
LKYKLEFLIVKRFFWNKKALSTRSSLFALGGLALGVAVLYVALAVMSGFESTLQKSLTDVTGHITVIKRSTEQDNWKEFVQKLKKIDSRVVAGTPFVKVEGVVAATGQVQGVLIQGLDADSFKDVLRLDSRLVTGDLNVTGADGVSDGKPRALIGKELAARLGKTVGDTINVVVPRFGDLETSGFRRTMGTFVVAGIMDLGKYEWNERLIAADLKQVQKLAELQNRYSGILIRVQDAQTSEEIASKFVAELGHPYWIRDWKAEHENIFMAIELERRVIFLVVFILVVVAAFAVSSNLLLQTLQKSSDVAVLKSMGFTSRRIRFIFMSQGLMLGFVGVVMGMFAGAVFSVLINLYQKKWGLIAGSVYKIDHIDLSVRWVDIFWILSTTLLICWCAGLIPAWRASRRLAAEGLRYE